MWVHTLCWRTTSTDPPAQTFCITYNLKRLRTTLWAQTLKGSLSFTRVSLYPLGGQRKPQGVLCVCAQVGMAHTHVRQSHLTCVATVFGIHSDGRWQYRLIMGRRKCSSVLTLTLSWLQQRSINPLEITTSQWAVCALPLDLPLCTSTTTSFPFLDSRVISRVPDWLLRRRRGVCMHASTFG